MSQDPAGRGARWRAPRRHGTFPTREYGQPDTGSETDMTTDTTDRMKIVIYYAIWATICAAAAGLVIAGLHTWLFSYIPSRSGLIFTMVSDAVTALAIAAGQGAVALVTGSGQARIGNPLERDAVLGPLQGPFGFVRALLPQAAPRTPQHRQ